MNDINTTTPSTAPHTPGMPEEVKKPGEGHEGAEATPDQKSDEDADMSEAGEGTPVSPAEGSQDSTN